MEKVQKKYKDNVFRKLFNTKENALVLYNILHNTNYKNYNDIELVTLEDILYNNRKNDLAFTFNNKFVILVEQQSTVNENMPLRMLIYVARLYEKLIKDENIYREKLIKINTCEFYVFYNGTKDLLDRNKNKVTEKILKHLINYKYLFVSNISTQTATQTQTQIILQNELRVQQ